MQINGALEGLIKESEGEVKPAKLRNLATEIFSWLVERLHISSTQGRIAPDEVYNSYKLEFLLFIYCIYSL